MINTKALLSTACFILKNLLATKKMYIFISLLKSCRSYPNWKTFPTKLQTIYFIIFLLSYWSRRKYLLFSSWKLVARVLIWLKRQTVCFCAKMCNNIENSKLTQLTLTLRSKILCLDKKCCLMSNIGIIIVVNFVHLKIKMASWMFQKMANLNLRKTLKKKIHILNLFKYSILQCQPNVW